MRWVPLSSRSPPALLTAAKGGMSLTRPLCALSLAVLAAFSVVVRPTATLTWLYVGLYTLFTLPGTWPRFVLIRDTVVIAAGAVVVSCLADRLYYGVWVFVPWEFVRFNLGQGSEFYGSHPWHWNFTQGFPVVLIPITPLLAFAFLQHRIGKQAAQHLPPDRALLGLIVWVNLAMSLPAHKEFRFLLPALPAAFVVCGRVLFLVGQQPRRRRVYEAALVLIATIGVGMAAYFSQLHQRGGISAIRYASGLPEGSRVHFLTPCHSSPARRATRMPPHRYCAGSNTSETTFDGGCMLCAAGVMRTTGGSLS